MSHPTTGSTIRHSEVHTDIRVVDTEGADPAKRAAETELSSLLEKPPSAMQDKHSHSTLATEQERDPDVLELRSFIERGILPPDEVRARKMALQQSSFALVDGVLYFVDPKWGNRRRAVVPELEGAAPGGDPRRTIWSSLLGSANVQCAGSQLVVGWDV